MINYSGDEQNIIFIEPCYRDDSGIVYPEQIVGRYVEDISKLNYILGRRYRNSHFPCVYT